ncbi:MAG TPA: hypothetical protein DHW82_00610 [Spirochaetia bacterium]|nr:MAG: hypothetical protein A2Y41_08230 [Spirochaetes bacterium GWB1_36_13]HCL55501.1 hypothetical protein [Spirochaetia bacterium]
MNLKLSLFFLASLFLLSGGLISFLPSLPKINPEIKKIILKSKFQVRMGLYGIFSIFIFCFLSLDSLMVIGDLLPLLSSLFLTVLFWMGYIRDNQSIDEIMIRKADKALTTLQVPFGFLGFFSGILHIFLAELPIL